MHCYTSPKSYELVVPSGNNCQPPQNKLRTESINSGNIRSIYDTTLLTGTNRLSTTSSPIWASSKSSTSGNIDDGNFVVNTDGTVTTGNIVTGSADIFNSSSSEGNDSFTPPTQEKAGVVTDMCVITRYTSTGEVMKVAGIKLDNGFFYTPIIIKHSDGGYYLVVRCGGNPTILDASIPDGNGNLIPPPITHDTIDMGGKLYLICVKYSSELVAEWVNFITFDDIYSGLSYNHTIDSSDSLVLLFDCDQSSVVNFYKILPGGIIPTNPDSTLTMGIKGSVIANFSNQGVVQLVNKVGIAGTPSTSDLMMFPNIGSDNAGDIIITVTATVGTGNIFNIYNSGGLSTPTVCGTFDSTQTDFCCIVVKYDSAGQVKWVIKNDILVRPLNSSLLIDASNNVYSEYYLNTPTPIVSNDQNINSAYMPPATPGPFVKDRIIGTIQASANNINGDYQTFIKYNSSGEFQWLSLVADSGTSNNVMGRAALRSLRSGDILNAWSSYGNGTMNIYKRSLAPTVTNIGDDGGPFSLVVDFETPPANNYAGSGFLVRRNYEGDNVWASMYDMTISMIAEDTFGNIYCSGFFSQIVPVRIFNAGNAQTPMVVVGTIPGPIESKSLLIELSPAGSVKWVNINGSMASDYAINSVIAIDVSTSNIILSLSYYDTANTSFTISNRIEPLGNGQLLPIDYAGTFTQTFGAYSYLINIGGVSAKLVHPSYNLMYPNSNNKTIINTSKSDAVIYGRGLLINMGAKVYEAVLAPGSTISLLSISNGCRDGYWIITSTHGEVKIA